MSDISGLVVAPGRNSSSSGAPTMSQSPSASVSLNTWRNSPGPTSDFRQVDLPRPRVMIDAPCKSRNLTLLFSLCLGSAAPAADFHVSPSGNDTTGDGSAANPWKTLAHAAAATPSFNTIRLAAGTYRETAGSVIKANVSVIGAGPSATIVEHALVSPGSIFSSCSTSGSTVSRMDQSSMGTSQSQGFISSVSTMRTGRDKAESASREGAM